jgi:2-keto-4-pentenoate hydratase/2-oxohepta-3-ene-1,7-dioic acid hydratase in catechol pathway
VPLTDARLLAPIPRPPSVRDFMAFEEHVVNALGAIGMPVDPIWHSVPVFYFSNPAAIVGPHDDVPVPPGSRALDYELEVAAIVGRAGSDLNPLDAQGHIAGYTMLCDWSARDLQMAETKVGLGPVKGKDTATSLGPFLVTPDELEPRRAGQGFDLAMSASVNGRPYSRGNWADVRWSFEQMLAYASRGTTLRPGDVIGSGTVGSGCIIELSGLHGSQAYPWLAVGDEVRLEVELLGEIVATVVAGAEPVLLE